MRPLWKEKSIGEVLRLEYGKPLDAADRKPDGLYPVYGANGEKDRSDKFYFDRPSIIVGRKGSAGEVNLTEERFWPLDVTYFVTFDERQHVLHFLFYLLTTLNLPRLAKGVKPGINRSDIYSQVVRIPPLPEQRRIVGILDEAFEGIATAKANAEKNLQNARALFESHLQSVFTRRGKGWKQKTLEQIATTFGRGRSKHRPRNEKKLYGGKYPFIQTGDIRSADHFITEYSQTYSEAGLAQSKLWPKGTICITIAANIAETGILGSDACFPDSVIGVIANPKEADAGYVEYLLRSFKVRLQSKGKGSAQANINMGTFEHECFPFPSVAEQKQIVVKLEFLREKARTLESLYQRKLAALDELKKALLHQAFSGQLTAGQSVQVRSNIIPFPATLPNITTTDLHAGVLAMAYDEHQKNGKEEYFTHVKAEKIAHMVEAHLGLGLGRAPVKDAAGPNDFPHLKKVEFRARKANFFDFRQVGNAYRVRKLGGFERLIDKTRNALGDRREEVERLLRWMLPMTVQQAEIMATVFAAWNNLLLDGVRPTDEQIVFEARENWHPDKLKIPRQKFFAAVQWLRKQGRVPEGKGRRVVAKGN